MVHTTHLCIILFIVNVNERVCAHKRGRGSRVAVGIPPHRPVDVYVLDKQGHQQIKKEQKLKQQAAVQRQLRDPRVTDRLRSDEGRERRGRQTHRITVPERRHGHTQR